MTPYQSKYIAWLLDRDRCSSDEEKFTSVLTEAKVDLNPHQIEAALFAFHSPLDKGAILADEVGLGKTIEAALVIAQQWAKHCRHILIIAPATLRKQWSAELEEKFHLPSVILERKSFNAILADTYQNPFSDTSRIVICSYQFAKKQMAYISRVDWDLVVMDEAHKLRNVYRENKTALAIKTGLSRYKKLLLTATPLQNNIKELYGLISIVDRQKDETDILATLKDNVEELDDYADEWASEGTGATVCYRQDSGRRILVTGAAVTKPPGSKSSTYYISNMRLPMLGGLVTAAPVTRMSRWPKRKRRPPTVWHSATPSGRR